MPTQGPFQFINTANAAVTGLQVTFRNSEENLTNPVITQGPAGQAVAAANVVDIRYSAPVPLNSVTGLQVDCPAPGIAVDSAFWTSPAGPAQVFGTKAAVDREIADLAAWAGQLREQQMTFNGNAAQRAADEVFNSDAARQILAWTLRLAESQGFGDTVILPVWKDIRSRTVQSAAAGTAFDSSTDCGRACWQFTSANLGRLMIGDTPSLLIAEQNGLLLVLSDASGNFINPESAAGTAVLILDIILEILGGMLLLVNVALPAIQWERLAALAASQGIEGLETATKLLGVLYQLIVEGAPMEKILRAAIEILNWAWGSESAWGVIKGALGLDLWGWLELIAKLGLLIRLEVGGAALSDAKIALVVAVLSDIVLKKIPKLTGEQNPHMKSAG